MGMRNHVASDMETGMILLLHGVIGHMSRYVTWDTGAHIEKDSMTFLARASLKRGSNLTWLKYQAERLRSVLGAFPLRVQIRGVRLSRTVEGTLGVSCLTQNALVEIG